MDTKQLLNDEELTAVAGGNQASMNQWSQSVGFILRQLEDMAANASAADQAVLRRYISALKSTCSEAGTESASITIANIYTMNVLFVNACVREQSRTLLLARHLLSRLPAQVSEIRLEDMDMKPLTKHSLSQRDELLRQGKWEDPSFCLARQFADADCIVIAAPYWDFGFPALLKIYLETVTVSGITFCYEEGRPRGLCKAKKLYYITTAGGPIVSDFGYPYVQSLAENLYGIGDTICIRAENLDMDGADVAGALEKAKQEIDNQTR